MSQEEYRFYGRRYGRKLSVTRSNALETVLPKYQIKLDAKQEENSLSLQDFFADKMQEFWLEIGFGNGEHLIQQAIKNPNIGMIGCEPFINGVSKLLTAIEDNNIKNIRIWIDDARILMKNLKKQSLTRCFLLHPDPWPKKKHHKRRFIQTETLEMFANLMAQGAELRMATDDKDLANWMLIKTWKFGKFTWLANEAKDWRNRTDDWPETRYGQKQLAGKPVYLRFIKK